MIKQYKLRFYNFRLVLFLVAISAIGIILVGSARDDLRSKQLIGVIMGLLIMTALSLLDYSWISNFQWILYGVNIVLLLIVRLFGDSANGAAAGSILDSFVFSLQSCQRSLLFCFSPGSLWIMRKI